MPSNAQRNLTVASSTLLALLLAALMQQAPALAQSEDADSAGEPSADTGGVGAVLSAQEATRLLAQPLPEAADARYALLARQLQAARLLEDRQSYIELTRQLMLAGNGRAGGEKWITSYLNAEFTWGSSGKALDACEPILADSRISLETRARVALRQTYFAAQGRDRQVIERDWQRADDLAKQALKLGITAPARLTIDRLQVRSEVERWRGDPVASVSSLREAVGLGRREVEASRARTASMRDADFVDAYGWLDGSMGMLNYALTRQGRSQEAIELAQGNLALWRAGQISEGLGARWNYRLAAGLNATQRYETALGAARLSDEMLERSGASVASHTRWMARKEIVHALMGLRRWKEADTSYREFLAGMPADLLAHTRASDTRLLALLAAKNGRMQEGLEIAERLYRNRLRLYGAKDPQTQEAAGVRAVVRLMRGDIPGAMQDYEALFAATLDSNSGWLDLDLRGFRGHVLGIAFDDFMQYVASKAAGKEPPEAALTERALQIADRNSLGVTQRALADSTARLLADNPAMRAVIEQEQVGRQALAASFGKLNEAMTREDALRRQAQSDDFKQASDAERKEQENAMQAVRAQIKGLVAEVAKARSDQNALREKIARQFPSYADLVTPSTPKADQLRQLMAPDEALIVVQSSDEATLVWLLRAGTPTRMIMSSMGRAALTQVAGLAHARLSDPDSSQSSVAEPMYSIYRELLLPLQSELAGVRTLMVATQGPLASLPLAALVTQAPLPGVPPAWLLRQMAVTQLPSPSALQALRRAGDIAPAAKALMGFGDPLFALKTGSAAPADKANHGAASAGRVAKSSSQYDAVLGFRYADVAPLPETRAELLAIGKALGADLQHDLVFGAQATRRAVLQAKMQDRRVVAFATHGLMPGELPGVSKPALAMAADEDPRESPLLELDDVLGLRLNAQWVLLSACNTAAGEQGGAAMSGLVRGFFFAGARSVLATHWAVDSDSAAALSAATFSVQSREHLSRAQSLRQAQLGLLDGQDAARAWGHPFFWAAYALFGDPSR